jgi:hypothetical protein
MGHAYDDEKMYEGAVFLHLKDFTSIDSKLTVP